MKFTTKFHGQLFIFKYSNSNICRRKNSVHAQSHRVHCEHLSSPQYRLWPFSTALTFFLWQICFFLQWCGWPSGWARWSGRRSSMWTTGTRTKPTWSTPATTTSRTPRTSTLGWCYAQIPIYYQAPATSHCLKKDWKLENINFAKSGQLTHGVSQTGWAGGLSRQ